MRVCPTCGRRFDDADAQVCAYDGARLVDPEAAARAPSTLGAGTVLDDRYVLQGRLGGGGMGDVFIAKQTSVGREVAIKVLGPETANDVTQARRFLREVRASSALQHPHIITIHDFGQTPDGLLYLVMERVRAVPLSTLLARDGALPVRRAARLCEQMLDALATAHEAGIVHRDLKPDNVLIGEGDHVTLLDFGIAAVAGHEGTALTMAGQVCGTPDYMAPERARGEPGDHRADLYAMGVMLFEMLSGARPFVGRTALSVMTQHVNDPPPPLEVGSGPLRALVARALEKQAADRFADAAEMRRALHLAAGDTLRDPPRGAHTEQRRLALGTGETEPVPSGAPEVVVPSANPADTEPVVSDDGADSAPPGWPGRSAWATAAPWLVAAALALALVLALWPTDPPPAETAPPTATPATPAKESNKRLIDSVADAAEPIGRLVDSRADARVPDPAAKDPAAKDRAAKDPAAKTPAVKKRATKRAKKVKPARKRHAIPPSLSDLK